MECATIYFNKQLRDSFLEGIGDITLVANSKNSVKTGGIKLAPVIQWSVNICYRYLFRLIADPSCRADQRKLGLLLHDCIQVTSPRYY